MPAVNGYGAPAPGTGGAVYSSAAEPDEDEGGYREVSELRKEYRNYLSTKANEIDEKRESRHYFHGNQWGPEELALLKKRGQPKITKNRISRKINAVVGLIERLRQDPKAYPRNPDDEQAAEIATAVIRFVLDSNRWESLSSRAAREAAIEGLGGIEMELVETKFGDYDLHLNPVAPDCYFYDPRSYEHDFSDSYFEGVAKWADVEIVKQIFPDKADEIEQMSTSGSELGADTDREGKWVDTDKDKVRLVDHWYRKQDGWCWCIYAGSVVLKQGHTPFFNEDDAPISKFVMFSCSVDHDGDRYGFVRNLKDTQDEINHRYSKALHLLNTRRGMSRKGSLDVEKARKEAVRPDGWIEWDLEKPEFDDQKTLADMAGQLKFLEDAKSELENFGPNPALIGQGIENKSGRAIALLQQAGIAELGPYIVEYKDWKLRLYRAAWQTVKKYWSAERFVRVTDNNELAQLLQVNGMQIDPMTGQPQTINSLGQIDVDIIIDEGSDTINMMADAFDTLSTLAARGAQVPPGLLIELAPIQSTIKKKWLEQMEQAAQPDPMQEQAKQIALESETAKIGETKSKTIKNLADAGKSKSVADKTASETMPMLPLGPVNPFATEGPLPPTENGMFEGGAGPMPPTPEIQPQLPPNAPYQL